MLKYLFLLLVLSGCVEPKGVRELEICKIEQDFLKDHVDYLENVVKGFTKNNSTTVKFYYGQTVKVTKGFFRNTIGTIVEFKDKDNLYTIKFKNVSGFTSELENLSESSLAAVK